MFHLQILAVYSLQNFRGSDINSNWVLHINYPVSLDNTDNNSDYQPKYIIVWLSFYSNNYSNSLSILSNKIWL